MSDSDPKRRKNDIPVWAAIPGVALVIFGVIAIANGGAQGWVMTLIGVVLLVGGVIIKTMRDQRRD